MALIIPGFHPLIINKVWGREGGRRIGSETCKVVHTLRLRRFSEPSKREVLEKITMMALEIKAQGFSFEPPRGDVACSYRDDETEEDDEEGEEKDPDTLSREIIGQFPAEVLDELASASGKSVDFIRREDLEDRYRSRRRRGTYVSVSKGIFLHQTVQECLNSAGRDAGELEKLLFDYDGDDMATGFKWCLDLLLKGQNLPPQAKLYPLLESHAPESDFHIIDTIQYDYPRLIELLNKLYLTSALGNPDNLRKLEDCSARHLAEAVYDHLLNLDEHLDLSRLNEAVGINPEPGKESPGPETRDAQIQHRLHQFKIRGMAGDYSPGDEQKN